MTSTLMSWLQSSFRLPIYGQDSWRRETLKGVSWCVEGEVGSKLDLGEQMKSSLAKRFSWGELGHWGNCVWCLIIVVIPSGLERVHRWGQVDFKVNKWVGKATKGWDHFLRGSWSLETTCKDFHLAIGGGHSWVKWLKSGVGTDFIFHVVSFCYQH